MACYFYLESKRKNGLSPIFIRVQDPKHKLDIRQATKLLIEETIWQTSRDSKEHRTYCKNPQIKKIFDDTDEIRNTIDQLIEDGKTIDKDSVRQLISDIIYRDEREATEAAAAEAARLEAEANRVTLRKFIEQFRKDIKAGKRLTDKGTVYAPGTINAINQACERLKKFEKKMKREYDFDDIDMNFYRDYTAYLNEQGYAINTTGKCVEFENVWNENEESAFQLFNDEWRARKYVVLCHDSLQKHKDTHQAAAKGCLPQYGSAPGSGKKARVFERYFVDVNDEALDYFIRFTQPISPRVKWLGSRAEAVIFAEKFGLTAKDMNRSFIIPSRSGGHRDLNLAGDTPTNKKDQYPVWKAIMEYQNLVDTGV